VHYGRRLAVPDLCIRRGDSASSADHLRDLAVSPSANGYAGERDLGAEPVGNSSVEMAAQIKNELETFGALTKQLQLVVD
jgi:hypothetical protein